MLVPVPIDIECRGIGSEYVEFELDASTTRRRRHLGCRRAWKCCEFLEEEEDKCRKK